MLFHYNRELLPSGFIGVDVFFVISGFLITSILIKQKEKPRFSVLHTLKQFYISRIERIIPAYYVLLVVVVITSVLLLTPKDYQFFYDSLKYSLWFDSNHYFAGFGNYFAPKSDELPLLHTWSLAIEMQFYLFYPFLILLIKNEWLKIIIPVTIVTMFYVSVQELGSGHLQLVYYALYARVPEFLIGASVILFAKQYGKIQSTWLSIIGLVLVLASFVLINDKTPFPGLYAIPSFMGTALLLADSSNKGLSKWLSLPILVWMGAISYSLYLWHWPILVFIRYITGDYNLNLVQSIYYWGGTFILACVSYYWVEQQFRKNKVSMKERLVKSSCIMLFFVLVVVVSSRLNKSIVPSLPLELTRYADPDTICHGKIVGDCIRGNRNDKKKPILVLGDSHAAMLNYFFEEIGEHGGGRFKIITASSCVPVRNFDYQRIADWAHSDCLKQISAVEESLNSSSNIVIITALWRYHLGSQEFRDALITFFGQNQDKKFLLLADIPGFINYEPLRAQRLVQLGFSFQKARRDVRVEINNHLLEEISNAYDHVEYVDLVKDSTFFLSGVAYEGQVIYYDSHHLNEIGSKIYAKSVYEKLTVHLKFLKKGIQ